MTYLPRPVCQRFIPTPVGSIERFMGAVPVGAVHPHACGEYVSSIDKGGVVDGSSPRLWGVCSTVVRPGACGRFIPTPVGSMSL